MSEPSAYTVIALLTLQAEAMLGDKDKRDEVDAVMRHARVQVLKP
jgi:hypothetical protein